MGKKNYQKEEEIYENMRRYNIYNKYIDFYQDKKDIRSMDEICKNETDFNLQLQQKFLKDFTKDNKEWDRLLLYHQIGSGKTCTAITIAEEYLKNNPDKSVIVILPARLKTNFIDELISPCGVESTPALPKKLGIFFSILKLKSLINLFLLVSILDSAHLQEN